MNLPVVSDPRRAFTPAIYISFADKVTGTGDGKFREATWTIGAGKKTSNCSFSLHDKDASLSNELFTASLAQGGLDLPDEFFEKDQEASSNLSKVNLPDGTPTPVATSSGTAISVQTRDRGKITVGKNDIQAIANSARNIGLDPRDYLAIMMFESGVSPSVQNSGGYTGLIQFGRQTAINLGTSTSALRQMTIQQQLPWVEKYFKSVTNFRPNLPAVNLYACVLAGDANKINAKDSNGTSASNAAPALARLKKAAEAMLNKAEATKELSPGQKATQSANKSVENTTGNVKQESTTTEISLKGTEITIAANIEGNDWQVYTFIHHETEHQGTDLNILSLKGKSVRGIMETRIVNKKLTNITLKKLAQMYCADVGCNLKMDVEGPKYEVLSQVNGKTDHRMLLNLCERAGYYMYDDGPNLIIGPLQEEAGYVIRWGDLLDKMVVKDTAQEDIKSASSDDDKERLYTVEPKTVVDTRTGQIQQQILENKAGKKEATPFSTGLTARPITYSGNYGVSSNPPEPQKNYKEYTLQCEFTTTQAALSIRPLQAFYVVDSDLGFVNQKWWVESITHSYRNGACRTSVQAFIRIVAKRSEGSTNLEKVNLPGVASSSGSYQSPLGGSLNIGEGLSNGEDGGRKHRGVDFRAPSGTPVYAMAPGKVTYSASNCADVGSLRSSCGGGYGNYVEITHSDGTRTIYAHLLSDGVIARGTEVKAGQEIGKVGSSGRSSGPHLHLTILGKNNQVLKPSDIGLKLPKPTRGAV